MQRGRQLNAERDLGEDAVADRFKNANDDYSSILCKALADRLKEDVEKLKQENPKAVPVDLVTTSGSGLDPDISPEGALFQVPRVAKARNLPEARIRDLVVEHTQGRMAGLLGEPRVNVLALNLALDEASK